LICAPVSAKASAEIEIIPQDVMVWNNSNYDVITKIQIDLASICVEKLRADCRINNISTFINLTRDKIFYLIDFKYIDDVRIIYVVNVDDQNNIVGKAWVSDWSLPILRRLPCIAVK
jgi:hypothetical protein